MSQVIRVTFTLPNDLWEAVKRTVPAGQRSRLVAAALENELRRRKRLSQVEQLRAFHKRIREKYGEFSTSAETIERMRQERKQDF